jgi:hypothetical protein
MVCYCSKLVCEMWWSVSKLVCEMWWSVSKLVCEMWSVSKLVCEMWWSVSKLVCEMWWSVSDIDNGYVTWFQVMACTLPGCLPTVKFHTASVEYGDHTGLTLMTTLTTVSPQKFRLDMLSPHFYIGRQCTCIQGGH